MFTIYMISRIGADVNFSAMTWYANTGPSLPTFLKNWKNSNAIPKTCNLSSLAGMGKLMRGIVRYINLFIFLRVFLNLLTFYISDFVFWTLVKRCLPDYW